MTCKDCTHYKGCLERDREYICASFKQYKKAKNKKTKKKQTVQN